MGHDNGPCCGAALRTKAQTAPHFKIWSPLAGDCTHNGHNAQRCATPSSTQSLDDTGTESTISETKDHDIEKGTLPCQHIVLSVNGLTCTGCETSLHRALELLPFVSNVKTSIALARAEFDFTGATPSDVFDIIQSIERVTGFKCSRISLSGEILELLVDSDIIGGFRNCHLPPGVTEISVLDYRTVRVAYDGSMTGARDIMADPLFSSATLAPVESQSAITSSKTHVLRLVITTSVSAILTIPVLVLAWAPLATDDMLYQTISLALATVIQALIGATFYINAFKTLVFSRMIEIDLLVVLSTTAAYVYSVVAYVHLVMRKPLSTGSFFETSTLLITLIMVGRCVSAVARYKAMKWISMESANTPTALLVDCMTGEAQDIDVRLLHYRDTFRVLPDTNIATDGIILSGESKVNESLITGEATSISKRPGMPVVAGSANGSGMLEVQVTRLPSENTINAIKTMVDNAVSSKPTIQKTADRFATYFIPTILGISLLTFVAWIGIETLQRRSGASRASILAMTYAIATLIISCPCAVGLAVPMVVIIAAGVGARKGLIFKDAETMQIARNISHVIFDKTGTLTQGDLQVSEERYLSGNGDKLAPMILGLVAQSMHPVSRAIASHIQKTNAEPLKLEDVKSISGNGLQANWTDIEIKGGNPDWLDASSSPIVQAMLTANLTIFCVTVNGTLAAVFGLANSIRPEAISTINALKSRSIRISLLSGDNAGAVNAIANQLSIPPANVRSRCSPAEKQKYVQTCLDNPVHDTNKRTGRWPRRKNRQETILYIGDGTNDAPALATATIGMHMPPSSSSSSSSTSTTITTTSTRKSSLATTAASVILLHPSLSSILTLIDLSRAFHRRVVFNFSWAALYNLGAILLAAGAFESVNGGRGWRIPPQWAGVGEVVSILPVLAVAWGLRWVRFGEEGGCGVGEDGEGEGKGNEGQ